MNKGLLPKKTQTFAVSAQIYDDRGAQMIEKVKISIEVIYEGQIGVDEK